MCNFVYRGDKAAEECSNILQQLGLSETDLDDEGTEHWEKKATSEKEPSIEKIPDDTVFDMLGLSQSEIQASGEAWESKTID